jgi:hypothetical protein
MLNAMAPVVAIEARQSVNLESSAISEANASYRNAKTQAKVGL